MMIQLLKSKTVWFAILIAVLSVVQGYVALLPVTPVQQMLVGGASLAAYHYATYFSEVKGELN